MPSGDMKNEFDEVFTLPHQFLGNPPGMTVSVSSPKFRHQEEWVPGGFQVDSQGIWHIPPGMWNIPRE